MCENRATIHDSLFAPERKPNTTAQTMQAVQCCLHSSLTIFFGKPNNNKKINVLS